MTESTRRWITQILLPAIFLFGGLAVMHGPAYVNYFQKQWLDYRLARDSLFGPEQYEVRLKAGFVSHAGEDCLVMVLTDKGENPHSDAPSRQEILLIDSWSRIVQRERHENVGAIQSTHLRPQDDGYAVLEIVRRVPDHRHMSEVARYQVTEEGIDAMDSELRHRGPVWDGPHRGGWHRRHGGHHRSRHDEVRNRWSRDRHDEHRWEGRRPDKHPDGGERKAEQPEADRPEHRWPGQRRPDDDGRRPNPGKRQGSEADLARLDR